MRGDKADGFIYIGSLGFFCLFFFLTPLESRRVFQHHVSPLFYENAKGPPVSCLTLFCPHCQINHATYSKRLPLSRGYLIVRGRRCFQESFFCPIKVAVESGIYHRNLPFLFCSLLWKASYCGNYIAIIFVSKAFMCWRILFGSI